MRSLVIVALVGTASANDEPPTPKPLRVEATLDGDTARFRVRYLVRAEKVRTGIEPTYGLPHRGLITAATVTEGGRRRPLALVAAPEARAAFGALFDTAPSRARTWAVLISVDTYRRDEFTLETAVPHRTTLVADLEITAPTCYRRDARYVSVPEEWLPRLPAAMRVRAGDAITEACGTDVQHDAGLEGLAWVKLPAPALAERAGGAERIGAYASRTVVGKTSFVKLELNLAAKLSEIPADLATVIVVDASRSTTSAQLEAQRATVAAYLRAAPQGRVQVVEYARHARALLPGWTVASLAAPRVARALQAMQRANGSSVSAGLREAGKWLGQTTGTRRIVLFTDELVPNLEEHAVADALPPNTLVHVVALGGTGLVRDDEAKLAQLAKLTRGTSVRGGEPEEGDGKPGILDATLLARPVTLDHVRVRTPGWESLGIARSCPDAEPAALDEGDGCTWWGRGDAVASPFVVEGWLWGERVERVLRADLGRSLEVVRELSAMSVLGELQPLAERAARAVNAMWALYGTWGGDGGYSDVGSGAGAIYSATCGGCSGGMIGGGFGTGSFQALPDLAPALERIVRTCQPDAHLALEVETTLEEIVGIQIDGGTPALRTCVEEALWKAWLVEPRAPAHVFTRFTVAP